jgi:DNA end-binding protein Ku
MPRSLWTGSLSFGLVNVPVQVFSAVRDQGIHFRQLHEKDGAPVETRRVCSKEGKEVPWEQIAHGFETDDGKMIVLTDEELAAADPRRTRTIDIEAFVDLPEIDPIWFDHPYWLAPQGESEGTVRAYRLLVEAMGRTDRVALGRFVMRTKEYLVAIRAREGRLALSTLLWHDEVRDSKDVDTGGARKPAKKELDQAVALIKGLTVEWDPSRYEDLYRKRLKKVIADKRKGRTVTVPEEAEREPEAIPDLMAALEQSIADMEKARKPKSGSGSGRGKKKAKA